MFHRILLALVAAGLAIPQEIELTLTNRDIGAMLKAGLDESTIALAIELAAVRGTTRFETSSQALIDLKSQGATDRILDAILAADALPKRLLPSATIPGLPAKRGVYHRADERWVELTSDLVWPKIKANWQGMTAIENRRYVMAGAEAGLRVREATPSFHVRGMDPQRVWQLIRLDTKKNYREWRAVSAAVHQYAGPMEQRGAHAPRLELRVVAWDVFELRPANALEPGEYALIMLVPGQRWLVAAYEFAFAPAP